MQNLNDQHDVFAQLYTHAPIGIALVSTEGRWLNANPLACEILGYTEEELVNLDFMDITHPDDIQANQAFRRDVLNGGSAIYKSEKRYIQKNGNTVWVSVHISLVRDETNGSPLYFIAHMIDISEKKTIEFDLLETKELYDLITGNVLDLISYNTPDGISRYISPSIRDLLGYEPEDFIGKNNFDLYHPDDLKEILAATYKDIDVATYRVRHRDGRYIWFETTFKTIRDEQGIVQKVIGIGRDITERKNYEDNLAEAQDIASLGSWEWDTLNNKVTMSQNCYEIFNINPEKIIANEDLIKLIHPDDQERYWDCFTKALKGEEFNCEFRNLQPDRTIKYLNIRISIKFDEKGTPIKMLGTTQDVTERKKVELSLEESVQRYTSLKKYNHDAIISLDLKGSIINCNAVAEKLTGLSTREMIGMSISTFIGAENLNKILSEANNITQVERNINEIKHKNSHFVEVLTTIAPIIVNKETVGYYIIAKDITEQKKLLIAKEAAEKMNKAKSEFLAMMSHEIRTPMNGVIGMTDLLLQTTQLDEQQKEYVTIINKSGETLLTLINDILDLSKIESGKTELVDEPFQMRELIAETLDIFYHKAIEKNLEMTVTIDENVPKVLNGDSNRLRQVLINVVGNAVKFTYSGSISISVQNMFADKDRVQCQFTIQDTGIGIPPEKHLHLFDPFYQLEHFMTRKQEGSGLGLAISKRLVELMNGQIWAESTDEGGASFRFTVFFRNEAHKDSMQQADSQSESRTETQTLKILIAEDNEVNQLVLKKMLGKLGYTATTVWNGNEVIQAAAYESYDVIFMDIEMPEMNGLEAANVLKETLIPEKYPYIVAVTANALIGDRERYLSEGMDDYISKPLSISSISSVLEKFQTSKKQYS
ncbi:PAS domain S-box protein [Paenibacillus sp. LPE1-1-1.1]|uniref:PAS domain S-box protein n=1 Tax=Paenibacillus sp. LPE1-1-1.1 TaxID=3135230 RepID=UPI00341B65E4